MIHKKKIRSVTFCIFTGIVLMTILGTEPLHSASAHSPLHIHTEVKVPSEVTGVAWSSDGKVFATYNDYGRQIDIWRDNGAHITGMRRTGFGPYTRSSIAFLADNHSLLTPPDRTTPQSDTAALSIWDIRTGAVIQNVSGPASTTIARAPNQASQFAESFDRSTVAVITSIADTYVAVYSTKDWSLSSKFRTRDLGLGLATSVALSADGQAVAIGTGDGRVALFRKASAVPALVFSAYDPHRLTLISSLSFSPDGTEIAVGGNASLNGQQEPNLMQIFSASNGRLVKSLPTGKLQLVRDLDWQPTGHYVAFAADDDQVRLWSVTDGELLAQRLSAVVAVSFSPTGDRLAVCNGDRVTILDLPDMTVP